MRRGARHLLTGGLLLDERRHLVAVGVAVPLRVELGDERVDELSCHAELAVAGLDARVGQPLQLGLADDLVREVHGGQHQGVLDRPQGAQVLLGAHDDAGDSHAAGVPHGFEQEPVGLLSPVVGNQVVGAVEEQGVDLVESHEVLYVDRVRGYGIELLELFGFDHHVLAGSDLVALGQVLIVDLDHLFGAEPLLEDPGAVLGVELVEAHVLLADGGGELHRHVHQPEADGSAPQ